MKNQILTKGNYLLTMLMLFLASPLAFAQEGDGGGLDVDVDLGTETTTTTTTEEWFTNPLYWIIGALLLLVIIAIIARGNRR